MLLERERFERRLGLGLGGRGFPFHRVVLAPELPAQTEQQRRCLAHATHEGVADVACVGLLFGVHAVIHHRVRDKRRDHRTIFVVMCDVGLPEPDQQVARAVRGTVRDATVLGRLGVCLPARRVLAQVGSDPRPVHVVGSEVATALLAYVVSLDDII